MIFKYKKALTFMLSSGAMLIITAEAETIVIPSPTRYVENPNVPKGQTKVITQGRPGQIITKADGSVTRTEATETVIEVGTQATIESRGTDKATTHYSLDESKDFGDDVIEQAIDGGGAKKTEWRLETIYDQSLIDSRAKDKGTYYQDGFWEYDYTKEKPSDRIVVKNIYQKVNTKTQTTSTSLRDYAVYGHTKGTVKYVTAILNPADTQTRQELGLTDDKAFYEAMFKANLYDIMWASGTYYNAPIVRAEGDADEIARNRATQYITDDLLADVKAAYARFNIAKAKVEQTKDNLDNIKTADDWFKQFIRRYNNQRVANPKFEWEVENTSQETIRKQVDAELDKLPENFRRFMTATRWDIVDELGESLGYVGVSQLITTKYQKDSHEASTVAGLRKTLLHELGHVVDSPSGIMTESGTDVNRNGKTDDTQVYGFSSTKEFLDLWSKHIKGTGTWEYVRDNGKTNFSQPNREAFAEGFAQYMNHRFYGAPYQQYIELSDAEIKAAGLVFNMTPENDVDGNGKKVFHIRPGDPVSNKMIAMYPNKVYTPWPKFEAYFERIYNQLFEQKRDFLLTPKAVSDTTVQKKDGRVVYGAKPVTTTVDTANDTVYEGDESMDYGTERKIDGKKGTKTVKRSYKLENNKPVAVETVLQDTGAVSTRIIKGTKPKVEKVNFTASRTIYKADPNSTLPAGSIVHTEPGSDDYVLKTTTYTVNPKTGEVTSNVTNKAQQGKDTVITLSTKPKVTYEWKETTNGVERIEITTPYTLSADGKLVEGTPSNKTVETRQNSQTSEPIKAKKRYVADNTMAAGQSKEVPGKDGVIVTTIKWTVENGQPKENKTVQRTEAVDTVITKGTAPHNADVNIPYITEYVLNRDMVVGETKETIKPAEGNIHVETRFNMDGERSGNVIPDVQKPNVKKPVYKVIEVGGKTTVETVDATKAKRVYVADEASIEPAGTQKVIAGRDGYTTRTTQYELVEGTDKVQPIITDVVVAAQDEIVKVSTRPLDEVKTEETENSIQKVHYRTTYTIDESGNLTSEVTRNVLSESAKPVVVKDVEPTKEVEKVETSEPTKDVETVETTDTAPIEFNGTTIRPSDNDYMSDPWTDPDAISKVKFQTPENSTSGLTSLEGSTVPSQNDTKPVEQPEQKPSQPVQAGQQPVQAGQQPVQAGQQPVQQPVQSGQQAHQPVQSGQQAQQPAQSGQQAQQPVQSGQQAQQPVQQQAQQPVQQPVQGKQLPEQPAQQTNKTLPKTGDTSTLAVGMLSVIAGLSLRRRKREE